MFTKPHDDRLRSLRVTFTFMILVGCENIFIYELSGYMHLSKLGFGIYFICIYI